MDEEGHSKEGPERPVSGRIGQKWEAVKAQGLKIRCLKYHKYSLEGGSIWET